MAYIIRRFESIHQFVKAARKGAKENMASHWAYGGPDSWAGSESFDQSVEFAMSGGWEPEDVAEFRSVFGDLETKMRRYQDFAMDRFPGPVGDEVNVAMFLAGEPDHMLDWVPREDMVQRRALCLVIGHSVSAGCSARDLFIRGQAVIGLVRALSMLGMELEIWSEQTISDWHREHYSVLTRLHAAGSIMDESAVEFAVGNPSWLRRLIFGLEEGEPQKIQDQFGIGGGYGRPAGIHHAEMLGADLKLDLGRTWFGETGKADERTAEDGFRWVLQQLVDLEVLPESALEDQG